MKFNVTITNPSPLIALGSLIFNGSSIWLDSVWETDSVPYTVYLDSTEFASTRTPSNDLLYHVDGLSQNEEHTVIIQPSRLLDSIIVEMDLGDEANMMMSMDDGQLFEQDGFVATGTWTTDACLGSGRSAGTCHVSEGSGSEISYTFNGDAITLWGAAEDQYTLYQVTMDGGRPISYAPNNATTSRPITILAHYSNLGPGSHTLNVKSLPKNGKSRIEVDYAQVYTKSSNMPMSTPTMGSTASSTAVSGNAALSQGTGISKSAIIGIVVGILVALLALIAAFFVYKRQQQKKKAAAAAAAAARRESAAAAAAAVAGVRLDFSNSRSPRSRDFDEETLASSKWSVKEGLELSVIESQTEAQRPEQAARGGFNWRS